MPYKTPKMTPKAASRARATARAQARTRQQTRTPGEMNEAGVTGYAVAKAVGQVAKLVIKQNKAARTYITKQPRTPAQTAADAASRARMRKINSKARVFNRAVGAAAATSGAVGFVAGQETQSRAKRYPTTQEPNRKGMAMNRAKAKIKQAKKGK